MKPLAQAEAPSNIALIKYMGKVGAGNVPTNSSLSWTLNHLRSRVEIFSTGEAKDQWQPLLSKGWEAPELSAAGQEKFLKHFAAVKLKFGISQNFEIRSANGFPSDCGLASSASSFAALTLATYELARHFKPSIDFSKQDLSKISQQGSGSSCRSFYTPWAIWKNEGAEEIDLPYRDLLHSVVVVNSKAKVVKSSEAHRLVATSDLFAGRPERAEKRLQGLLHHLQNKNWQSCYDLCWQEFWDMHVLFETSLPAFGYLDSGSLTVLRECQDFWKKNCDGPLVTMDAGPNVHLLWRGDQGQVAKDFLANFSQFKVLSSWDTP